MILPQLLERPESVVITAVSGTAVDISWSGSTYLSTSLHYTTYCTSSGAEMSQYDRVLLPGVNSASVTIEDDITLDFQYQHIFTPTSHLSLPQQISLLVTITSLLVGECSAFLASGSDPTDERCMKHGPQTTPRRGRRELVDRTRDS